MGVIVTQQNGVSYQKQMVTKNNCVTQTDKNVTKMSVITKQGGFVCVW